jgi:hypothetical protein
MGHPITIKSYVRFLSGLEPEFAQLEAGRMAHSRFLLRVGNYFGGDERTVKKHTEHMKAWGLIIDTGEAYVMRAVAREAVRQMLEDDRALPRLPSEAMQHA